MRTSKGLNEYLRQSGTSQRLFGLANRSSDPVSEHIQSSQDMQAQKLDQDCNNYHLEKVLANDGWMIIVQLQDQMKKSIDGKHQRKKNITLYEWNQ